MYRNQKAIDTQKGEVELCSSHDFLWRRSETVYLVYQITHLPAQISNHSRRSAHLRAELIVER